MNQPLYFGLKINFQKLEASKRRVFDLLSDGAWHSTREIQGAGGCDGCRRLRELRRMGVPIEGEPMQDSNGWQYRMRISEA